MCLLIGVNDDNKAYNGYRWGSTRTYPADNIMRHSLIPQLFDIRQDTTRLMTDTGFGCTRLGPIGTSAGEYHNNKKLSLEHNRHAQRQRHKYLAIGWRLGTRNREVFQGVDRQWLVAGTVVFKRPTLRQLAFFFSSSYLFTYVHSSWIKTTSTYFCLLGVHFFTSVTLAFW